MFLLLTACFVNSKPDADSDNEKDSTDTSEVTGTPPIFSFLGPDEDAVYSEGTAILFEGLVVDAEDVASDVSLSWTSSINGEFSSQGSDSTGSVSFQFDQLSAGSHTISVLATDSSGLTDLEELDLRVNALPVVVSEANIEPTEAFTGSSLICFAAFTDLEDGELTPVYEWRLDDALLSEAETVVVNREDSNVGDELVCTASASDLDGEMVTSVATISISNTFPTVSDVLISPETAIVTDTLTCTAAAEDIDEDVVISFSWEDGNGQFLGAGDSLDLSQTSLSAGDSAVCVATVTDSHGGQASDSATLVISNTAPTVIFTGPVDGSTTAMGSNVVFSAEVNDLEDLPTELSIEWSSSIDGVFMNQTPDSSGNVFYNTGQLSGGSHTITVQVTDTFGESTSSSITLNINMPPSAPTVVISPGTATTTDALNASVSGAIDPEGDVVTYSYAWFRDGSATGLTGTSVPSSETSVSELWLVQVTPNDGWSNGPIAEASVAIGNTDPELSNPSITPNLVYNDTTASCSATVTDPDGPSTPSVEWLLNTQSVGTGATLDLLTTSAMPEDALTCQLIVDDGDGGTDSTSVSVTVQNRPPVITSMSISPTEPVASQDEAFCEVLAEDPDGQAIAVSYGWVESGGATTSGQTLPTSAMSAGETWTCTATVSDVYASTSESLSVVIQSPCAFGDCDVAFELSNGAVVDMNLIPAGEDALGRFTLTNDFYISTTEITQGMYESLRGTQWSAGQDTSYGLGQDHPVYAVNWHMIADYANALTAQHNSDLGTGLTDCFSCTGADLSVSCTANDPYVCTGYRLPTEAEWDYAARSGVVHDFWTSDGGGNASADVCLSSVTIVDNYSNPFLGDYAWFCGNSYSGTAYVLHPVAEKIPNGFGLFDMQGNALEWMLDSSSTSFPYNNATTDPVNIDQTITNRVFRGGQYNEEPEDIRIERRTPGGSTARGYPYGFRLVRLANP